MNLKERVKAESSFNNSRTYQIVLMSEEPFIEVEDGTRFFIDIID